MTTETVDTRADAVARTFLADHPRLRPEAVTITPTEGGYLLAVEGATYRATMVGADSVLLVWVDPSDASVELAPAVLRRLLPAPEPVFERDPSFFDIAEHRRRAHALLDALRHLSERTRLALRQVATSVSDECARLAGLAPEDAVDSAGRPVDHSITLRAMCRTAVEVVALVGDLRGAIAEAETFRRATGPSLRAAVVDLETARRGTESLAGVPSLASLGETVADRHSQHEVNLTDLEDRLDTLRRACEEVAPLVEPFESAARVHASAMLETARRAACQNATRVLSRLRAEAAALRTETEAEALARDAAERLDVAGSVPRLTWPAPGSLEAPTLG